MKKGLVHLYTGDGKGKTTAAMGLAIRACGAGYDVKVYQFLKAMPSGELASIGKLPHIRLFRDDCQLKKFVWDMTPEEKEDWIQASQALFDEACEAAQDPNTDMVILDEVLGAMHAGAIGLSEISYLIGRKYRGVELVLTGRAAPKELIELADYVTEMKLVKHPYERGIDARRGVEF